MCPFFHKQKTIRKISIPQLFRFPISCRLCYFNFTKKEVLVMTKSGILLVCAAVAAMMVMSGCESLQGHEGATVGAAAGAAGGAAIGAAAAGSGNRGTGAVIGGVVGGALGGVAGDQLHDKKNR